MRLSTPRHSLRPAGALVALLVASWLSSGGVAKAQASADPLVMVDRIDAVEVRGLWRTHEYVVLRELPWKPGERVSLEAWRLGIERLWLVGIFSRIDARVEEREGRYVAVFELEERWTVNLLFRYGVGGGSGWIRLGSYDINTFGRFVELGGLWERFGPYNGFQLWARDPRLLDERQQLTFTYERLVRPRVEYGVVRSAASVEYLREVHDRLRFGLAGTAFDDLFIEPLGGGEPQLPDPSRTVTATGSVRFGRVTPVRLRDSGWQLEVKTSLSISSFSPQPVWTSISGELLAFQLIGDSLHLAARVQGAAMTDAQVQQRHHLGGLDMVRGYPDNFLRTTAYLLANVELRWVAFDSMFLAVIPALFVDGALAKPEPNSPWGLFSVGAGVRVIVPRLVRSGIRIDAAWPTTLPFEAGRLLSIGVFQFF